MNRVVNWNHNIGNEWCERHLVNFGYTDLGGGMIFMVWKLAPETGLEFGS